MLICEWCGASFPRPHLVGRVPRYCSPAHRQAAFRSRHFVSSTEGLARRVDRIERILRASRIHEPDCSENPCDCWLSEG